MASKTFNACRRCDSCGIRTELKSEEVDRCILQCSQCGKEYPFFRSAREDRLMRKKKERGQALKREYFACNLFICSPNSLSTPNCFDTL